MSELSYVEDELEQTRRRLSEQERAPSEGRVADWVRFMETRDYLRARVAELERRRDEEIAAEESEADLRDGRAA